MNKYGFAMLNEPNAQELAQIAEEVGAQAFRGRLQYPGPETGEWELDSDIISDILYELRDREVLMILASVDRGEPVHLCGICGFVLSVPAVGASERLQSASGPPADRQQAAISPPALRQRTASE